MARPRSAGLLLYRMSQANVQVLLVHPGGPYFQRRDEGSWTVPKGELAPGEDPLAGARRELEEETGLRVSGPFLPLGEVRQAGGKIVEAWAAQGDCDPATLVSNTFTLEWPPRSGRQASFPEIDRAAFFDLDEAARKINPAQRPFLDALRRRLEGGG